MKFKSFIMNPPYGNLHLPILKQMIETVVDNGGHGVSLQPVRWLQDPLKEYKQGTDYKRFGQVFNSYIDDIVIIPSTECGKLFGAIFTMDLGIYRAKQNAALQLDSFAKDELLEKILKILTTQSQFHTTISKKIEKEKRFGIRVKVNEIQDNGRAGNGGRKSYIGLYQTFLVINGLINGKDWTDSIQKNQHSRQEGDMLPYSIEFANELSAKNFIESTKTIFFQYLLLKMHQDIHMPSQWLPFMNDYSEPWTDERFYAYFDITPDEQKIIEKTVKDAKK
ncbi:MAG: hypothetical protein MJ187_01485 [Alphaproteobacteria bacterium]|nr:hypothetical protein [Alphaproteobacteria bacterium]